MLNRQKYVLRELVKFKCQVCKNDEKEVGELEVHRIKRGNIGGEYVPNNLMMVCKSCHRELHGDEFK
jgi:5-methylcytosine-specific restriction endonuclease McrA